MQYATVQEALRARNGQDVKIFNIPIPDRPGIFVGVSSTRAMLNDGMLLYDGIPQRTLKDGSKRSKVQSPGSTREVGMGGPTLIPFGCKKFAQHSSAQFDSIAKIFSWAKFPNSQNNNPPEE